MSSGGSGVGSCPTDWSSTGLVGTNTCCPGDRLCNACRPGLKKKKKQFPQVGPQKYHSKVWTFVLAGDPWMIMNTVGWVQVEMGRQACLFARKQHLGGAVMTTDSRPGTS